MDATPKAATREQRLADQLNENKDLQNKQLAALAGDESAIKKIPANLDKNFKIKEHDREHIHIYAMTRVNNEITKTYVEETRIIKTQPNNLEGMIASGIFAVYDDVKVIHDPRTTRPKDYRLKAEPVPQTKPGPVTQVDDSVLAAREQKIAEREKKIAADLERMEKLAAQIQGQPIQDPKPITLTETLAEAQQRRDELPDLDPEPVADNKKAPAKSHHKKK